MKNKHKQQIIMLLIALFMVFIGYQFFQIIYSPYSTQTALEYTMSSSVECTGVAVHDETIISYSSGGVYGFTAEDGERISAGGNVGEVFTSAEQASVYLQIQKLDAEIALLENAQSLSAITNTDVEIILKQAQNTSYDMIGLLDDENYTSLSEVRNDLSFYYNRMQVATGKEEDFSTLIAQKRAARDTLAATVQVPVNYITAPITGYFSSTIDGYENIATTSVMREMTPVELQSFISESSPQVSTGTVAKISANYKWYVYTVIPLEENHSYTVGGRVTISFLYTSATNLNAEIISVEEDTEHQLLKVGFQFTEVTADTVNLRIQPIKVSFKEYTGLRIDKRALRIVDGVMGVYVRYGNVVQFKPITPIFEDAYYYLVPLTTSENNGVKLYDEIIVEGRDLYDGKLLS